MDTTRVFAVIDELVRLLNEAAVDAGELEGVTVEDSWPAGRINSKDTVIVADADGDQRGATMRPGGGTRDDEFVVEVVLAAVKRSDSARDARDRAAAIQQGVERIVQRELRTRQGNMFGVVGLYNVALSSYKVRQFTPDKGMRECDVHMRVTCKARLKPQGAP